MMTATTDGTETYPIGELCRMVNLSQRTIRYYE